MENCKARAQRAASNREEVAQVAPPAPITSISATPPPASTPRPSPDSDDISSRHSVTPTATMLSGSSPASASVTGSTQQEPNQTLAAALDSPTRHPSASQSQSDAGLQQPTELQTPAKATGVTFFARIQTSKGDIEMQFPEKLFTGNMTVFEAYRQFREKDKQDTDLTYKQFERIMKSAL